MSPGLSLRVGLGLAVVAALVALVPTAAVGGVHSARSVSTRLAFVREDGIYAMRSDGSGVHLLRKGRQWFASALAWSPDGRRLAFATRTALWVMNADGSDPVRLTPQVRGKFGLYVGWMSPTWSPDGTRIAYTFSATAKADRNVWVMNADGTNKHLLARTPDCAEVNVDWSPTGATLVTTCVFGWGTKHLILINLDNGARHTLYQSTPPNGASAPDWAPSGQRIAFADFATKGATISIIDAQTGSLRQLVGNRHINTSPVWSPDGTRIAFDRLGSGGGIYTINTNGSGLRKLTDNGLLPAWQPNTPT